MTTQIKPPQGAITAVLVVFCGPLRGLPYIYLPSVSVFAVASQLLLDRFQSPSSSSGLHAPALQLLDLKSGSDCRRDSYTLDDFSSIWGLFDSGSTWRKAFGKASGEVADHHPMPGGNGSVMQATTGQSIEETISKFEQIAKSPVDALLKLNETEHFLTRQQLARVDALIAEGDETRAVAEATSIYKQHLNDVADAAEAARPHLASLWSDLRKETSAAWAEVKDFAEFLAATQEQFKKRSDWQTWGPWGGINYLRDMSRAEPANATTPVRVRMAGYYADESEIVDPEDVKAREAKKKAQEEWNRWTDQNLSKREKQQAEEAKIIAAAKVLGKSQADVDAEIAASRARFAESQRSSAGGSKGKDPVVALAERIKQQITLNTEQLQSEAKLTTSQRLRIQVEQELLNLGPKATAEQWGGREATHHRGGVRRPGERREDRSSRPEPIRLAAAGMTVNKKPRRSGA